MITTGLKLTKTITIVLIVIIIIVRKCVREKTKKNVDGSGVEYYCT